MTLIKLKHIDRFVDRHGRERFYFRRSRGNRVPLPGRPGSPEFIVAYEHAAASEVLRPRPKERGAPGTFDRLVQDYFSSPDYLRLAPSTKKTYRSVIERLIVDECIGHRLVREMGREHVRRILAKRSATPGAANSLLQKLKVLLHFAIDNGWRMDDPTLRIKKFEKGEFHTWTEEELTQFERGWPIGTTERLAYALLLYTGQRRSDVVGMSWSDVRDGSICVTPLKTKRSTGMKLWIPIHPALQEVLEAVEKGGTNTVEGYFSVFKRGMRGTYQHCKEKHLHRYLAEFDFRYNNRSKLGVEDVERATNAVKGAKGKRLTYRRTDGATA
jgi:integrase